MNNYEFINFQKTTNPNKKYDAFLKHKKTGKIKKYLSGQVLINIILIQQE
jgi:hypothetical protein